MVFTRKTMRFSLFVAVCYNLMASVSPTSISMATKDTLVLGDYLLDGQTLVSSGQRFEFGFFSPENSSHRYLGIWYRNLPLTVVWVANRNNPTTFSDGKLELDSAGILSLYNVTDLIWIVYPKKQARNPILQLLDSGNVVLRDGNGGDDSGGYLWESFDYPCNTLLPGMKLGWNLKTGLALNMTSWKSTADPSFGDFTLSLEHPESPQLVLHNRWKEYRWGPWDGVTFSGIKELKSNPIFMPIFTSNAEEVFYTFKIIDTSVLLRLYVNEQGFAQYLTWSNYSNKWVTILPLQSDNCDRYGICGPYGSCYRDDPNCRCLNGFVPKSPQEWNLMDWSRGCIRKWDLVCSRDDFVKYEGLKLPDNSHLLTKDFSPMDCHAECLKNCSCMAFTNLYIYGNGSICLMWFGDLIDMRHLPRGREEMYIRMGQAELDSIAYAKRAKKVRLISIIIVSTIFGMFLSGVIRWCVLSIKKVIRGLCSKVQILLSYCASMRNAKNFSTCHKEFENLYDMIKINYIKSDIYNALRKGVLTNLLDEGLGVGIAICNYDGEQPEETPELPYFSMVTISNATNNFTPINKIGQGGFGSVYKGVLPDGQEIAVKRLSNYSHRGLQEFMNEIVLIANLQHHNLVHLFGCCVQGEERMLIYEYLSNKSLDFFLFDETRRRFLTWKMRFNIAIGIARGILYLHQDSGLRIIHRDLKASNILLDGEMIPKISDFGLARIIECDQTEETTKSIIGTYGYMAPEYALCGHFSVKSDVFSFGVLLLEIISGKRNWRFYHPDHDFNLIGHAWKLWSEANALDILDALMEGSFVVDEVIRCIQVAILCVQLRPEDRPLISYVVNMLSGETSQVPQPKIPVFSTESSNVVIDAFSGEQSSNSLTEVTDIVLDGHGQ